MSDRQLTPEEIAVLAAAFEKILDGREKNDAIDREMLFEVAAYLVVYPRASANAVDAYVTGRRTDVLSVVREIRERSALVPGPGNQVSEVGS